jgi:hypothetical protein
VVLGPDGSSVIVKIAGVEVNLGKMFPLLLQHQLRPRILTRSKRQLAT